MDWIDKARIVRQCMDFTHDNPSWQRMLSHWWLGFAIAVAALEDLSVPTERGNDLVEATYDAIIDRLGIENRDYSSFNEMIDARLAL